MCNREILALLQANHLAEYNLEKELGDYERGVLIRVNHLFIFNDFFLILFLRYFSFPGMSNREILALLQANHLAEYNLEKELGDYERGVLIQVNHLFIFNDLFSHTFSLHYFSFPGMSNREILALLQANHLAEYNLEKELGDYERGVLIRRHNYLAQMKRGSNVFDELPYKNYDYSKVRSPS
jgi:hypothetical protein